VSETGMLRGIDVLPVNGENYLRKRFVTYNFTKLIK
jgi:hypothetical protein